jgi:Outer membrane protein beta-barrel domain
MLLVALLLLVETSPLAAQSAASVGVELGYRRADFYGSGVGGTRPRSGAVAGAYFRIPLTSWLAVQPGLLIASKGGASTVTTGTPPVPLRFELDLVYLDVPVLLRARIPAVAGPALVLIAGGGPGVRIGCNVDLTRPGSPLVRTRCDQATGATFRTWDVALEGGVGLGIPIERNELSLEARLSRGLRSVSGLAGLKNRGLSLLLSVPF